MAENENIESENIEEQPAEITDEDFNNWYEEISGEKSEPVFNDNDDENIENNDSVNENATENTEDDINFSEEELDYFGQERYSIKANGMTHELTLNELIELAPKAFDYTKKMQEIAPHRKMLNAIKENNISENEINRYIEMKNGNIEAIGNFLRSNNIDLNELDFDEEALNNYRPRSYGKEENQLTDTVEELKREPKYNELQTFVLSLDNKSKQEISNNPSLLKSFMDEINHGIFYSTWGRATQLKTLDNVRGNNPKTDIEYYVQAMNDTIKMNTLKQKQQGEQTVQRPKSGGDNAVNQMRKSAALTGNKNVNQQQRGQRNVKSASDISDEDLDAFMNMVGYPH